MNKKDKEENVKLATSIVQLLTAILTMLNIILIIFFK